MVTRATKQKTTKQISTVDEEVEKAHPLVKSFIAEYRKENARLQNLIAKNQVAHESEINKIRAQAAAQPKLPQFVIGFVGNEGNKSSDSNNEKPKHSGQ